MEVLSLHQVNKTYSKTPVLRDINLSIHQGEFIVFVGQSGCGKSTLLRLIAGLDLQTSGDVRIDGTNVNDVAPAAWVSHGVSVLCVVPTHERLGQHGICLKNSSASET